MFTISLSGLDETAGVLPLSLRATSFKNIHNLTILQQYCLCLKASVVTLQISCNRLPFSGFTWFHLATDWIWLIWYACQHWNSFFTFCTYEQLSHMLFWLVAALRWQKCHSLSFLYWVLLFFFFFYTLVLGAVPEVNVIFSKHFLTHSLLLLICYVTRLALALTVLKAIYTHNCFLCW